MIEKPGDVRKGVTIVLVGHAIAAVPILFVASGMAKSYGNSVFDNIYGSVFILSGILPFAQFIYIVPAIILMIIRKRTGIIMGIVIAGAVTLALCGLTCGIISKSSRLR